MKIYDEKTKRTTVVFKEYQIGQGNTCPECNRPFKEYDLKRLEENGKTTCPKCGAKIKR